MTRKYPSSSNIKSIRLLLRPTMTYGAECWTMKKKDDMLMNKTEMRMLRWIQTRLSIVTCANGATNFSLAKQF